MGTPDRLRAATDLGASSTTFPKEATLGQGLESSEISLALGIGDLSFHS